jgi:uncharacterized protein
MNINGEYRISAPQQRVWDALNDPEMLRNSLPGCKALEQTGANEFTATVAAKIGPVSATFKGKVELSDLDPPNGYTLSGRGQGGPAGFAKGSAQVRLLPDGDETILRYNAEVDIGGKLASVGSRLINGVATNLAEQFFGSFGRAVAGGSSTAEGGAISQAAIAGVALQKAKAGHIPLIDRCAWLVVGFGLGIVATLACLGRL